VAAQLFHEQGYAATSTRELASILGITKASLYHHIRGKEDLLHAICLESLRRVHGDVAAALDTETAPRERIRALIRAHLRSMLNDLDMHSTMLVELKSLTGERYDEVQQARDRYEDLVANSLQAAQEAGELRNDISAKHLTLGLLNLLNWNMAWYKPHGDLTPDQLADILSLLFLEGATASREQ